MDAARARARTRPWLLVVTTFLLLLPGPSDATVLD
jgi:hypothetical protein